MSSRTEVAGSVARVDGLNIAFASTGEGDPALVFIVGGFEDRSYFDRQADYFAGQHRVVAVEVRGPVQSSVPPEATIDSFVRDLVGVAETTGIKDAVLCGHSMSGIVALKVANARPDLVRGV